MGNNIQEKTRDILNIISEHFESDQLNNDSLIQIIEHCGEYLNLMTRADYGRCHKKSYNGVKKFRKNIELFGTKFIIDND